MNISERALNQYKAITALMAKTEELDIAIMKGELNIITDFGFKLMEAATKKEDISLIDNAACISSMEYFNTQAAQANMEPIFDTNPDMIVAQAINFINAVIIIRSVRQQEEKKNEDTNSSEE